MKPNPLDQTPQNQSIKKEYPDYACQCCGYTNGDMFQDRPGIRTPEEIAEFNMYRKMWHKMKEQIKAAQRPDSSIWPKTRIGQRHSEETRQKISATKKRQFKLNKCKELI